MSFLECVAFITANVHYPERLRPQNERGAIMRIPRWCRVVGVGGGVGVPYASTVRQKSHVVVTSHPRLLLVRRRLPDVLPRNTPL